jgi:hypothetical protein
MADLDVQHERALALGARLPQDRSDDPAEALRVYADPARRFPAIVQIPDYRYILYNL